MSFLLNLIPAQYRLLAEIAIVALIVAAVAGWVAVDRHQHYEAGLTAGRAEVQAKWDAERAKQTADALAQAEANAKETQRRLIAQKEAQDAHDKEIAAARADADAARSALGRLSQRANQLAAAARRASGDSTPAGTGTATPDAAGVLADLLGKLGDRAQRLAEYADTARGAGEQCARAYDALTP